MHNLKTNKNLSNVFNLINQVVENVLQFQSQRRGQRSQFFPLSKASSFVFENTHFTHSLFLLHELLFL